MNLGPSRLREVVVPKSHCAHEAHILVAEVWWVSGHCQAKARHKACHHHNHKPKGEQNEAEAEHDVEEWTSNKLLQLSVVSCGIRFGACYFAPHQAETPKAATLLTASAGHGWRATNVSSPSHIPVVKGDGCGQQCDAPQEIEHYHESCESAEVLDRIDAAEHAKEERSSGCEGCGGHGAESPAVGTGKYHGPGDIRVVGVRSTVLLPRVKQNENIIRTYAQYEEETEELHGSNAIWLDHVP
mmetsp:Transcript_57080/g.135790  ORF Transcript_57080/g.135790 Transcript_57080/m.135790 type:complete len:242 (+) Transcript_57080:749-1474(+)